MNLEIYNSIIFGSLYPKESQLPENYSDISHILNTIPNNLKDIETHLHQVISKSQQLNFDSDKPINTNQFITDVVYTPIIDDEITPKIKLSTPLNNSPFERYYSFIIKAEAKRIKFRLKEYAQILQDDLRCQAEIKETLGTLANFVTKIIAAPTENKIFPFLISSITELYYEITIIFDILLKTQDYISFDDFHSLRLKRLPEAIEKAEYLKAVHIHQAQQLFYDFKTEKAIDILSELYSDIDKIQNDTTLNTVTCAIENVIFLNISENPIPDFTEITESTYLNSIVNEVKDKYKLLIEREEVALNRANTIDKMLAEIKLNEISKSKSTNSIPYQILNYLLGQRENYLKDPSAVFKVILEKQVANMKNKAQPVMKPMKIKTKLQIVHDHLAFLDGVNPKNNERIMSEEQYKLLVSYVEYLVQNNEIPKIIQKIHKANLPKTWFKYTLYLIHQELFNSIQDIWIEFIQKVFDEYSPNIATISTIKTKFSVYPSGYSQFPNTVNS